MRNRIHEILEQSAPGDHASRAFYISIMTLIILNVLAVVLETVQDWSLTYEDVFTGFEVFSVAVFTVEYILRIWVCTSEEKFRHPLWGRLRYAITPMALIDLLAIVPFYLPMVISLDLRFVRALRLFRLFRLFKVGRYSDSMKLLGSVLKEKKEELVITFIVVLVLLILASTLMYYAENEAQPEAFSSVPAAMWWGVATLTTVGYGDVYPVTAVGKFLGTVVAILGIGMFALPAGIFGSGFVEQMNKRRQSEKVCPHCGCPIDEKEKPQAPEK
ncbi:MAG: ion transporter [Dehalococcoidia bacterium]|nr:MAG: ion transporter [Dehalococcoidia bacterium]